jgi:hypothetical protein
MFRRLVRDECYKSGFNCKSFSSDRGKPGSEIPLCAQPPRCPVKIPVKITAYLAANVFRIYLYSAHNQTSSGLLMESRAPPPLAG